MERRKQITLLTIGTVFHWHENLENTMFFICTVGITFFKRVITTWKALFEELSFLLVLSWIIMYNITYQCNELFFIHNTDRTWPQVQYGRSDIVLQCKLFIRFFVFLFFFLSLFLLRVRIWSFGGICFKRNKNIFGIISRTSVPLLISNSLYQ